MHTHVHTHTPLITVCWTGVFPWESWTLSSFSRIPNRSLVSGFSHRSSHQCIWPKIEKPISKCETQPKLWFLQCCILKTQNCYGLKCLFDPLTLCLHTHICTCAHIHSVRVSHDKTGKGQSPVYHLSMDYLLWSVPLCVCVCVYLKSLQPF